MASSSYRTSTGSILRSPAPTGRFRNSRSQPSSYYSSSSGTSFFHKSTPPNNSSSVSRSVSVVVTKKRTCMCAPTTHPGSFRCSLHKSIGIGSRSTVRCSAVPNRHNAWRSAMTNSLVRTRGVEGEFVKRVLAVLLRPSSHHQRRHGEFLRRPTRLCVMSKAGDS